MLEADLQATIVEAMQLRGFRVAHFRPARTDRGWRTAGSYDAAGFPDLIAVRGPRCLAWELKSERGTVAVEQSEWIRALRRVPGVDARVIRPDQLDWALEQVMTQ